MELDRTLVVGIVWMLIENGFLPGTRGSNRFGPHPVKPVAVSYKGQTYSRRSDGSFLDPSGIPVRVVAVMGGLAAAYVASRADTPRDSSGGRLINQHGLVCHAGCDHARVAVEREGG